MKKLDKVSRLFNMILGVAYIPLSLFSWLLQMVSESTIDATNLLYITLIEIFCIVSFIIPFLCAAGIVVSVILRRKGHIKFSVVVQFLPLAIFILNLTILYYAESIPAII